MLKESESKNKNTIWKTRQKYQSEEVNGKSVKTVARDILGLKETNFVVINVIHHIIEIKITGVGKAEDTKILMAISLYIP